MKIRIIISLFAMAVTTSLNAALKDLPVTHIGGTAFYHYEVQPKETIYSLCQRFDIPFDYFLKCNPEAETGLQAGQVLYFPVNGDVTSQNLKPITHEVKKGETLYGISKMYDVSEEDILGANPDIADGLKTGQKLVIKKMPADNSPLRKVSNPGQYVVQPKETFYSIARQHGITVEQLMAANPGVETLNIGAMINIPPSHGDVVTLPESVTDTKLPGATPEENENQGQPGVEAKCERVDIAVLLPFMLHKTKQDKATERMTEFYKGMLLAVDSLRNSGIPITLRAYDTGNSLSRVNEILARNELKNVDLIIAPNDAQQLEAIGDFGRKNAILVFNPFVVQDKNFAVNRALMQGNIPSLIMSRKTTKMIAQKTQKSIPVFLTRRGGSDDKAEFTDLAREEFKNRGIVYLDIEFEHNLKPSDLASLNPAYNYIFIPMSSKQAEANRFMPGLKKWKEQNGNGNSKQIHVMGYPEWVTFKGETLNNMHALNAVVYSRFNSDDTTERSKELNNKFKHFYNHNMEQAVPHQGTLGFDVAMSLIRALSSDSPDATSYSGIQNSYHFAKLPSGGWYNDLITLIAYMPDGEISTMDF